MAFSYKWQDGLDYLGSYTRKIPLDTVGIQICDAVSQEIWNSFPWKEAVQDFPAIALLHGIQDYSSPPNFYKLVTGQVLRTAPSPESYDPLFITNKLAQRNDSPLSVAGIRTLSYDKGLGLLRLAWPPIVNPSDAFSLIGSYQMNHTRVTDPAQYAWFGDNLWHVAQEGLLYHGYKLGDRGKDAILQYKVFKQKIAEAWQQENQGSSDTMVPEINLGGDTPRWM